MAIDAPVGIVNGIGQKAGEIKGNKIFFLLTTYQNSYYKSFANCLKIEKI